MQHKESRETQVTNTCESIPSDLAKGVLNTNNIFQQAPIFQMS